MYILPLTLGLLSLLGLTGCPKQEQKSENKSGADQNCIPVESAGKFTKCLPYRDYERMLEGRQRATGLHKE